MHRYWTNVSSTIGFCSCLYRLGNCTDKIDQTENVIILQLWYYTAHLKAQAVMTCIEMGYYLLDQGLFLPLDKGEAKGAWPGAADGPCKVPINLDFLLYMI